MARLTLIAALGHDRVIGVDNHLPWRLPADLRRFKRLTWGKWLLMGRRTWDSLGRPLPGRRHLVLSRHPGFRPVGAVVAGDLDEALLLLAARDVAADDEVMVIGGAEVYRQTLPRAERLLLTLVDSPVKGDTFFPPWEDQGFTVRHQEQHPADGQNPWDSTFLVLERARPGATG